MVDHANDFEADRFPSRDSDRRAELHALGDVLPAVLARYALVGSTWSGGAPDVLDYHDGYGSAGQHGEHQHPATLPVAEMCGGTV